MQDSAGTNLFSNLYVTILGYFILQQKRFKVLVQFNMHHILNEI